MRCDVGCGLGCDVSSDGDDDARAEFARRAALEP
jgi:hypothetical protein